VIAVFYVFLVEHGAFLLAMAQKAKHILRGFPPLICECSIDWLVAAIANRKFL
jgi:hypothetical protein